jgi:hypothetical protein
MKFFQKPKSIIGVIRSGNFETKRQNLKRPKTQDGRVLRRYRRRWKVERLFSWLYNFRRLSARWEYHADNFLGMLQLGCIVILLRYF